MGAASISQFMDQRLDLIIDLGLIAAFFFLWLSWFRNGQRQKQMEQLLLNTSSQLEEASRHLSQATDAIKHLQQQEQRKARRPEPAKPEDTKQLPVASNPPPTLPAQNSTQATMILRMKREGESPQTIAEHLDMPLAQVKLLLKLHAASSPVE